MSTHRIINLVEKDRYDVNFQIGMYYHKLSDYKTSERYLRYAANSGNIEAEKLLYKECTQHHFLNEDERINLAAIDLLEQLVTPTPSEQQIAQLESAISNVIKTVNKITP